MFRVSLVSENVAAADDDDDVVVVVVVDDDSRHAGTLKGRSRFWLITLANYSLINHVIFMAPLCDPAVAVGCVSLDCRLSPLTVELIGWLVGACNINADLI